MFKKRKDTELYGDICSEDLRNVLQLKRRVELQHETLCKRIMKFRN